MIAQQILILGDVSASQYNPLVARLYDEGVEAEVFHIDDDALQAWTDEINRQLGSEETLEELYQSSPSEFDDTDHWQTIKDTIGVTPEVVAAGIIDRKCAEGKCACEVTLETLDAHTCAASALFSRFVNEDRPGYFVSVRGKKYKMYTA